MMKQILAGAVAFGFAASAGAVSFVTLPGAPDPGIGANETMVVDFDSPNAAGYSWTGGISTAIGSTGAAARGC